MRVVVTGSSGKVGREAVAALTAAGHRVVGLDTKPGASQFRTLAVDCSDFGQVFGALSGVDNFSRTPDAVVHLAAIPGPGQAPDHVTFDVNTMSTYSVLSACARLGIPRVVWSSSETLFKMPWSNENQPSFLPIDETSPEGPQFHYALAKQVGERLADSFAEWEEGMSIASLRFGNVFSHGDRATLPGIQENPAGRRGNLFGYVDAVDAGEACRLAVEAEFVGHHRLLIAAADTIVDIPTRELCAEYFRGVPVRGPLDGYASLYDTARARELIDYQPRVSWRQW
jgi:nucleoside-diphosphate-sugar epimerase